MPTLRKLTAPLFGAALLVAAAPVSGASFYAGNRLVGFCKGTAAGEAGFNPIAYNACVGYLSSMNDAEEVWASLGLKAKTFCIPEGTTIEQLRQVFLRHMDQRPEYWHFGAAGLAIGAFIKAWPCPD